MGADRIEEFVLKQRKVIQKQAQKAGNKRLPEIRLSIDNSGQATISFSEDVDFTDESRANFTDKIVNQKGLEAFAIAGEQGFDEFDPAQPIMEGWELIDVLDDKVVILCTFFEPLSVSTGDKPD